jgi:hypothetical protein
MVAVSPLSTPADPVGRRAERLSAASLRRIIEPDEEVVGEIGPGMVVPRELLSLDGLDVELSEDQWVTLSREEVASIVDAGVRFEAILAAGFGLLVAYRPDLTDPRITYLLHEMGEETRHSRLFVRMLAQLRPRARNPFVHGWLRHVDRIVTTGLLGRQAVFCTLVLTGEEGPDLLQRRAVDHPATDPFVREVNRCHRAEEARHLAFARAVLPELLAAAPPLERAFVRHVVPLLLEGVFDSLVHPGVYETVGLPGWKTWNQVRRSPRRRATRQEVLRPVAAAVARAGMFGRRGRLPWAWRRACGVRRVADLPSVG